MQKLFEHFPKQWPRMNTQRERKLGKFHSFRGYSYENSFLVVFPLNREKDIISLRSYIEIFPRLGEIYFGGLLGGKILREANIQNG